MAVSIQQAALNRFARWLEQKLTGVKVFSRWPAGGFKLPDRCITVVNAGPRQDQSIEPKTLSTTGVGPMQLDMLIAVEACTQAMQLDVWATTWPARDDILAQLDDIFHGSDDDAVDPNPGPTSTGIILKLEDGWEPTNTFADFDFENPDCDETGNALERAQFRATSRGEARFMLTVTRRVARQAVVNFSLLLAQTDAVSARDLITVSGA